MSDALTFILTNQGLQALINAEADGTQEILLSHVGFGDSRYTPDASMTALKHEITRVSAVSGANVGDHIIHITASDDSNKSYNIYEAGIYATVTGEDEPILFAIYSRPDGDPIIQKSSLSRAYLAFDLLISSSAIDQITFGDTNFLNPPATTTTMGVAELATEEEVELGTAGNKIVTPATLLSALSAANSQLFKSLCAALKANSSVMLPVASRTVLGGVKVDGLKGVKIGADGMLSVDFSSMPDDQLEEVVLAMVQEGGGISVDGEGKLYVDFESMPTDKFEAMLKSIKVPIWLTKNTNFYVNRTTGSDVLDEGRGLSADKPFKTIQACVNFVCDNYNLSRYVAYIRIADGVYEESVTIGKYTASTGYLHLIGNSSDKMAVILRRKIVNKVQSASIAGKGSGEKIYISYITFEMIYDTAEVTSATTGHFCVWSQSSALYLFDCKFKVEAKSNANLVNYSMITASADGIVKIFHGCEFEVIKDEGITYYPYAIFNTGFVTVGSATDESPSLKVTGDYNVFYYARNNAGFSVEGNSPFLSFAPQGEVTGRRFFISTGSWVQTFGQGSDYFPGSVDGYIDTSTYSWLA